MSSKVEVVVSGIGGIFPNSLDLNDFKNILLENINTSEQAKWLDKDIEGNPYYNNMPPNRDTLFDASFFAVHSSQAIYLDPMSRLLLEKTFEALIDAGVNPIEIRGKNIPVIIGTCISENDISINEPMKSRFSITGQARVMIVNRVSYWLDIKGTSSCVDANWNSGTQAIEDALMKIQSGMYDSAIVGATILSAAPYIQWIMEQRGLLANDGQTKPYVDGARGYSRGDGIVVMYLQRSDIAKRSYTTLLYSHTIFNGNRSGDFSVCDPDMFTSFLEECYRKSGIKPEDIAYLETYGCGLKEIDENELLAVERVFCKNRSAPLQIGSVKTNIGHIEPVSALMSLIKIIVAMETGILPAHLNYSRSETKIPALVNGKIEVVTENREWTGELAAINCMGVGSSYGHIIVRYKKQPRGNILTNLPALITYSTRTEEGIQKINESVSSMSSDIYYNKLVNDVFSRNISGHLYRAYDLRDSKHTTTYKSFSGEKPPIWFIYSGMGSQWKTMGRDLLKLPIFAEAVQKCHDILKPKGIDLLKIITDDDDSIFENILNSFVGIAAVQIGLTDILNSIGIYPDGIIGHSVGELGCAYADKCLTAEEMILSAYYRGKASLDADLITGMMAAIGMGHSKLKPFCPETIDIACHNSGESCTISGPVNDVTKFVDILESKLVFAKLVNVSNIAYHSRYIKPAAPYLLSYMKNVIPNPKPRSSKWISTSVSQSEWNTDLAKTVSPEYLTNNLLSCVQFEEGLPFVPNNAVAIEIAPHGLLQAILRRALPTNVVNVPLTNRESNNLEFLFNALGKLFLNGVEMNLTSLYPSIPLPVPTGTPSLCNLVQWEHSREWNLNRGELHLHNTEKNFIINLNSVKFQHLNKCRIDNRIFLPHTINFSFSGEKPPIWFIYSGMGSQWKTMGRDLLKLPIFAEAVQKCHDILKPKGIDLLKIITDDDDSIFENILNSFVGIAAVQIGLTDILNSIGIYPDGIIGHSVGELGCAYADKCLTAEEMILSAYYRGKASLDADLITGMMAAIGMGHSKLKPFCPETIDIACHNSGESCTISGPVNDVTKFVDILESKLVFAKLVNVSNIAYHSRYIKPAAPYLLSYMKNVIPNPKPRSSKWISTSVSQSEWNTDLAKTVSPEYLTNNLLSCVQFEEGLPFVPNNAVAIEIAPHGLLQAILRRALPTNVVNVPLTNRESNNLEFLFNALEKLFLNGVEMNLTSLYPSIPLPVPTGTPSLCNLVQWEHSREWNLNRGELHLHNTEKNFIINLNSVKFQHLNKCRIDNRIFLPHTIYFGLINDIVNKDGDLTSLTFENIIFKNHIEVIEGDSAQITILIQTGTGLFEVTNNQKIIVTGKIVKNNNEKIPSANMEKNKNLDRISENNFYKELEIKGYKFPDECKMLSSIDIKENGFKAYIKTCQNQNEFFNIAFQTHLFYNLENSQHLILPKFVQRVHIIFEDFKKEQTDPVIWCNNETKILESNIGIYITGIKYEKLEISRKPIKIEKLQFVDHFDNDEDIVMNFNLIANILLENVNKNLAITELKEKYSTKYLPYIQNYLNQKQIEAKVTEINDIDYSVLQESSLTIISGKYINIFAQIIANINSYVLLCSPVNNIISLSNKYTTIAHFTARNYKFILIKEVNKSPVKIINIKDDNLSYKNMQNNSNPWTYELKMTARDEKRIFLVSQRVPLEGIQEFVTQMRNIAYEGYKLRFLFNLDPKAPECKPEVEFYKQVFEQDLIVQVFKNGRWGSYVTVDEEIGKVETNSALMRTLNTNVITNIYNPFYIGLHAKDFTRIDDDTIPCEVGNIDFVGTTNSGEHVMGFAKTFLNESKVETDPEFVWPVPKNWTLGDAATVPYAYTMAYYALFSVAGMSKGEVVLVHAGCSDIGHAALHVAYKYGCVVYTTVANKKQRAAVKKLLPKIDDDFILDSESTSFEDSILLQTKGRGVDVVLNCLPGERLQASFNLLGNCGRFIQLGIYDMMSYNNIGMKNILKSISFFSVTGQGLLVLPKEDKHLLHVMISNDMESGVVKPLPRKIVTENNIEETLRYLRSSSSIGSALIQINNGRYDKYAIQNIIGNQFQNQNTYLIYADSSDYWLSIIQYLVEHGVKRVLISNISNQNNDFVNRYLSSIKQYYNTDIILTQNNASSLENALFLSREISSYGNLSEAFVFVNKDEDMIMLENLDILLHQNKLQGRMVCILGNNKEKKYFRKSGLPVCNISWDISYDFQDVVNNFDGILNNEDKENVLLKHEVKEKALDNEEIAEGDLMFLPNNLKTLKHMGQAQVRSPCLTQLVTLTFQELRECPPVFLVPGLAGPYCPLLKQFVSQLMHPVFCVQLPNNSIPDDVLDDLTQQIRSVKICQLYPYKLIGVSWGGILAIELAKKLESLGERVELQLIDGAPKIINSFTNTFNKSGVFNTVLLKQVMKIDGKSMEQILSTKELSKFDYKDIIKSFTILKNLIEYTNSYKPLPYKIMGQTYVTLSDTVNTEENLGLIEHCEQIQYKVLRGNHRNILQNKMLVDYVNDNLM